MISVYSHPRQLFARFLTLCTLGLIFMGGLVTSTESALAVPDWPLSYGQLMPPMVGGIFYEHGHRMAATFVGLLTLILSLWTALREPRRAVRRLAWGALAIVVTQGVLGGITVLLLLPRAISVSHACLAQTFFCGVIALTYVTSREWLEDYDARDKVATTNNPLFAVALITTLVVFGQLLVGAIMRHSKAGLAIPDFPLAFGQIWPPLETAAIRIHFAHRFGAVLVFYSVTWLLITAWRTGRALFLWPALLAWGLVLFQIGLGGFAVLSGRAVIPTTLHVATGAALLGLCWFQALRAFRHRRHSPATLPAVPVHEAVRA